MADFLNRPFTRQVQALRSRGARYSDLQTACFDARSSAWFNTLCNSNKPWAVGPPGPDQYPGLIRLFGVPEASIRAWIAEEWYGVKTTDTPPRLSQIATSLSMLSDEDFERVRGLVDRFAMLTLDETIKTANSVLDEIGGETPKPELGAP